MNHVACPKCQNTKFIWSVNSLGIKRILCDECRMVVGVGTESYVKKYAEVLELESWIQKNMGTPEKTLKKEKSAECVAVNKMGEVLLDLIEGEGFCKANQTVAILNTVARQLKNYRE